MAKIIDRFKFKLGCSFCGLLQDDVGKLICGPMAHICDECIKICQEILDSDPVKRRKDGQKGNRRGFYGNDGTGLRRDVR